MIMKKQLCFVVVITTLMSCNTPKNRSGEIDYLLITNNYVTINEQLKNVDENIKDSLYTHYTSIYSNYDTTRVKIYFDLNKLISKEVLISSTQERINDYYKSANIEIYRKNNTELIWMETYEKKRYKIKEILDSKNKIIPYSDGNIENLKEADPILDLKTKSGKINFAVNYPGLNSGEFDVWFASQIPLSVGPQEFYVKDLFLLKAISKDKSFRIETEAIKFMEIDEDVFEIPTVFFKETNMEGFHHAIGM